MIRQHIYLEKYDWHVWVYYALSCRYAEEIMKKLEKLGCSYEYMAKAWKNLSSCKKNTGLTYSNFFKRASVMVVSISSSPKEFQNTYDHEKGHLCQHIVQAYDIDPFGEEVQYLAGEIGSKTFNVARKFLCEHCRNSIL